MGVRRTLKRLGDREQAEFEVVPNRSMFTIGIVHRGETYPADDDATRNVLRAAAKWNRIATPTGEALCLTCDANFAVIRPAAFIVCLPTAKMHKRGKMFSLVCGVCETCSDGRDDDEPIEIARKKWAPESHWTQEGHA